MLVKTRFAPSPTGMLHVGNARTALINWLFTRSHNGVFMLRMDDTDLLRSRAEYEVAIKEDLNWLGLNWSEYAKQSERLNRYEEIKQFLINSGRLYPCYETQNELDMKRRLLLNRGLPPIYDRAGLKLTKEDHEKFKAQGIKPHYRFLLEDGKIEWNDLIRGPIQFQAKNLGDPIVIREDGSMTYILCSAIDDIDFEITHVLRGEDHITNTAIGIQITNAIGKEPPKLGHISLLKNKVEKISKRIGGFDIKNIRDNFIDPMSITSLLAKMGSSDSIEAVKTMEQLIDSFDISKFSLSAVNYDFAELKQVNHKLLSSLTYLEAQPRLSKFNAEFSEEFWNFIKSNINTIDEAYTWWKICYEPIAPEVNENDKNFLLQISDILPTENWDLSTWDNWIAKVKTITDRSGKSLFMPIRIALTGRDSGPELKNLLVFIGQQEVTKRLRGNS